MALTVDFWIFGKRENNTIQPNTTPLKTYNTVQLKDDCSVVNPALKIRDSISNRVPDFLCGRPGESSLSNDLRITTFAVIGLVKLYLVLSWQQFYRNRRKCCRDRTVICFEILSRPKCRRNCPVCRKKRSDR